MNLYDISLLPESKRIELYKIIIPPKVLLKYKINPDTLTGEGRVELFTHYMLGEMDLRIFHSKNTKDYFLNIVLADYNNGLKLTRIILQDPLSRRYNIDRDSNGTFDFGEGRNIQEEVKAMKAGLAPYQTRKGSGMSKEVFLNIDLFLSKIHLNTIYLDALSHFSAKVFEKLGYKYLTGRELMETIDSNFSPQGRLTSALDGSTPFREIGQGKSLVGRAWAIHDGILEKINLKWEKPQMYKTIN